MDKVKVAVIGVGHLGQHHARLYSKNKNVQLVGICDTSKKRAKRIARLYHTVPHTDYTQLLGKVDVVNIASPTDTHHEIAKAFLNQKVHVLLEKPITKDLSQAKELVTLAQKQGVILQVGHVERFNAAVSAAESVVKNPFFIECHRLGPFKKRSLDVGVVLDLMIHDIEIILGFIKSPLISIEAVGVPVLSDHEDIANVRLKYANGAVCNITASRLTRKQMRRIRVFQKDTYVSLDYEKQAVQVYKVKDKKIKRKKLRIKPVEPLKVQLESFIDCVSNNKKPKVSGKEATDALEIALGIVKEIASSLHSSQ